jgi:hypothetical protein
MLKPNFHLLRSLLKKAGNVVAVKTCSAANQTNQASQKLDFFAQIEVNKTLMHHAIKMSVPPVCLGVFKALMQQKTYN